MLFPGAQLEIFLDTLSGWSGEKKEFSPEILKLVLHTIKEIPSIKIVIELTNAGSN